MGKRVFFNHKAFPYLLLAPQLLITLVFFFWPAGQAIWQSFFIESAFGGDAQFVGFENYVALFNDSEYYQSFSITLIFSSLVASIGLVVALILALMANRVVKFATSYKTLIIWPYAVAPAVVGVLWVFMFSPSIGTLAVYLSQLGISWNPQLNTADAMILVVMASIWKQISYNFLFFLAGLQAIPRSLIEAAAIDGAGPWKRFWSIVFPLLSPTTFFLFVINMVYAFFDTFAIIDVTTQGGPGSSTNTLVYNVYKTAFRSFDYGSSGAQSVLLLIIVIMLTVLQFRYIDRKVNY
jgi:sn-glycerol 3-phosphate transport system permease protein